jgi:hypothetical protein
MLLTETRGANIRNTVDLNVCIVGESDLLSLPLTSTPHKTSDAKTSDVKEWLKTSLQWQVNSNAGIKLTASPTSSTFSFILQNYLLPYSTVTGSIAYTDGKEKFGFYVAIGDSSSSSEQGYLNKPVIDNMLKPKVEIIEESNNNNNMRYHAANSQQSGVRVEGPRGAL